MKDKELAKAIDSWKLEQVDDMLEALLDSAIDALDDRVIRRSESVDGEVIDVDEE